MFQRYYMLASHAIYAGFHTLDAVVQPGVAYSRWVAFNPPYLTVTNPYVMLSVVDLSMTRGQFTSWLHNPDAYIERGPHLLVLAQHQQQMYP